MEMASAAEKEEKVEAMRRELGRVDDIAVWFRACAQGEWELLEWMVKEKGMDVDTTERHTYVPRTALQIAAGRGDMDTVVALVERCGADTSRFSGSGQTLIQAAVFGGHLDVLRYFVERCGQDPAKHDALQWAAGTPHLEIVKYLVEECGMHPAPSGRRSPIHAAARHPRYLPVLRYLVLECRLDVDLFLEPPNEATALHCAVAYGNIDAVRFLVEEADANLFVTDHDGNRPLTMAQLLGNNICVEYLEEAEQFASLQKQA